MESIINIGTSEYKATVHNGVKMIDGKTIDDFVKDLPVDELVIVAKLGKAILEGIPVKSPQRFANELHQSKNN